MVILPCVSGEGISWVTRGSSHSLSQDPGADKAEEPHRAQKVPRSSTLERSAAAPSGVAPEQFRNSWGTFP